MPLYEYQCEKCEHQFSRHESIADHGRRRLTCPKCKSTKVKQLMVPFYVKTVKKS